MEGYDHKEIEKKWSAVWKQSGVYTTPDVPSREKAYVLDMFPYPSGDGLHVGHPKGYIATDVYSRLQKMRGKDVLHPMGWDAFGLPAENFAIKNKVHPRIAVEKNIAYFKEQLGRIGFNYDWSREINTTDPSFYKWTQWIFLQLFKKGLAYESHEPINWCPSCQTGLANEDLEQGKCERCGSVVEKRPMRQWVLRITEYAERLLTDLKDLSWPEYIKESQRNWIGKSEGAEIGFIIQFEKEGAEPGLIPVFTTRPDTIFGATYMVLSPEHAWVKLATDDEHDVLTNKKEVRAYVQAAAEKDEIERTAEGKEKTGVQLQGVWAVNPATKEKIPLFVADYVLAHYGTGAVMAVPAHDERDFAFAKKFNLPVTYVIAPYFLDTTENSKPREGVEVKQRSIGVGIVKHWSEDKYLMLDWKNGWTGFITGGIEEGESHIDAIAREIKEETGYTNVRFVKDLGGPNTSDFYAPHKNLNQSVFGYGMYLELVSDNRIAINPIEDTKHTVRWISGEEVLSFLHKGSVNGDSRYSELFWDRFKSGTYVWNGSGKLINSGQFDGMASDDAMKPITESVDGTWTTKYKLRDWVFSRQRYWGEPIPIIHCEKCGVVPVPEKDLPVLLPEVEHYEPTGTGESPLANISEWVNTTCPTCGGSAKRETNTMPQWAGSSWYYLRYIDPKNDTALVDKEKEKRWSPVDMYVGGAEHATRHLIYARFWHKFLYDIDVVNYTEPFMRLQNVGLILAEDGRKMSKRYGNVINPDDIIDRFGADALRLYEMFMGPFDQAIAWSTDGLVGTRRFLERVLRMSDRVSDAPASDELLILLNQSIKKVGDDIESLRMNTAISQLMIFSNALHDEEKIPRDVFTTFIQLLAPFAPFISEEIWQKCGGKGSIHESPWPAYDPTKLMGGEATVAIQVNGKVRGTVVAPVGTPEATVLALARGEENIEKWLNGKDIVKVVHIPDKVLNIVARDA